MNSERGYPWLKLPTGLPFDFRYSRLSDAAKAAFIEFLCMAGQADAGGLIASAGGGYALTEEEIAYQLHRDPQTIDLIFSELLKAGFIEKADDGWEITNFLEEQGSSHVEKKEEWRNRQNKRRLRIKQDTEKEKEVTRESRVTPANTDITSTPTKNYFEIEVFQKVTGMTSIPGSNSIVFSAIEGLRSNYPTVESMVEYLVPFWTDWINRKTKDNRPYPKASNAWLTDWAVTGEIPPYRIETKSIAEKNAAVLEKFMANIENKNG